MYFEQIDLVGKRGDEYNYLVISVQSDTIGVSLLPTQDVSIYVPEQVRRHHPVCELVNSLTRELSVIREAYTPPLFGAGSWDEELRDSAIRDIEIELQIKKAAL